MTYIYGYKTDKLGYPTGELFKEKNLGVKHKKGKHTFVVATDPYGNEIFIFCEACGLKKEGEQK